MRYSKVIAGVFRRRLNRFVAIVEVDGREAVVHVKNTGRCRELLLDGVVVYLAVSENPLRKTAYDLVAVEKRRMGHAPLLVNMDSQAPNEVAAEWLPTSGLFAEGAVIRREVTWGKSRFDFCIPEGERISFLEVKGVTLEEDGLVSFPDAPTERGVKHLHELIACHEAGYGAYILFVVQMKEMRELRPNDRTHAAFGEALRLAAKSGVRVLAMDCRVAPDSLAIDEAVPVVL